jgi:hypothetical protein
VIHRDAIVKVDVIVRKNTAYRIESSGGDGSSMSTGIHCG